LRQAFGERKNLLASCGKLSVGEKTFPQVAASFRWEKKPSRKLQQASGGKKNLLASCSSPSGGKKTFSQVAAALRVGKKTFSQVAAALRVGKYDFKILTGLKQISINFIQH